MKKNIFQFFCALAPLLVRADGSLYFENEEPLVLEERRSEWIEKELVDISDYEDGSLERITLETPYQHDQSMLPADSTLQKIPSRFQLPVKQASGFSGAEFLYWKLDEAATTSYAVYTPAGTPVYTKNHTSIGTDVFFGEWKQVFPEWSPGFRVKGGYRFERDLWELAGVYTFYFTDGNDQTADKSELAAPLGDFIEPLFGVDVGSEGVNIKAKLNFWYHVGDIELAREFVATPYISIRFAVGSTIAFIEQKINFSYFGNYFFGTFRLKETQEFENLYKWTFKGGGVKLSTRSRWDLGRGFSLLFGGGYSSLYGNFKNIIKATVQPTAQANPAVLPSSGTISDVTINNGKVAFATQLDGGVSWNQGFSNFNLELFAKYELNTWFNITDQYRAVNDTVTFDTIPSFYDPPLNLQGIKIGATVNF